MTSYALIEVMSHHKLLYKRMQHVGVRCIAPLFRQPLNQAEVRQHGQLLRKNILACALLIYPGLFSPALFAFLPAFSPISAASVLSIIDGWAKTQSARKSAGWTALR